MGKEKTTEVDNAQDVTMVMYNELTSNILQYISNTSYDNDWHSDLLVLLISLRSVLLRDIINDNDIRSCLQHSILPEHMVNLVDQPVEMIEFISKNSECDVVDGKITPFGFYTGVLAYLINESTSLQDIHSIWANYEILSTSIMHDHIYNMLARKMLEITMNATTIHSSCYRLYPDELIMFKSLYHALMHTRFAQSIFWGDLRRLRKEYKKFKKRFSWH